MPAVDLLGDGAAALAGFFEQLLGRGDLRARRFRVGGGVPLEDLVAMSVRDDDASHATLLIGEITTHLPARRASRAPRDRSPSQTRASRADPRRRHWRAARRAA